MHSFLLASAQDGGLPIASNRATFGFFALGTQRVRADKTEFALVLVCSWYYMILAHLVFVFTSRSEHILSSARIALHGPNRSALGSPWSFYGASDGIISTPMTFPVGSRGRLRVPVGHKTRYSG